MCFKTKICERKKMVENGIKKGCRGYYGPDSVETN